MILTYETAHFLSQLAYAKAVTKDGSPARLVLDATTKKSVNEKPGPDPIKILSVELACMRLWLWVQSMKLNLHCPGI